MAALDLDLDLQWAVTDGTALPSDEDLERWVRAALAQHRDEAQLTLRMVDEAEIRVLNQTYRHKQGTTNVLSFPFEAPPGVDLPLLGDVVICAAVVAREAQEQGKSAQAHWAHMVVHGCLHLLGYDHIESDQAQRMEGLETRILADLGYDDPYRED